MDRHTLTLASCGFMLLLASSGCRSTRSEVPPGRPYTSDGRQMPPGSTLFSSDAHPMAGNALSNTPGGLPGAPGALPGAPGGQPGSTGQFGTPGPGASNNWGAPTGNAYGPPGTAGVAPLQASRPALMPPPSAAPPSSSPAAAPPSTLPTTRPDQGTMGQIGAPPSQL